MAKLFVGEFKISTKFMANIYLKVAVNYRSYDICFILTNYVRARLDIGMRNKE